MDSPCATSTTGSSSSHASSFSSSSYASYAVSYASSLVDALKSVVVSSSWQRVGAVADLRRAKCRKLYAEDGEDLALIYVAARDAFFAMEAVCAHEGGPLEMGDIEDAGDGKWVLVCPWHHFEFDVETGG